MQACVFVADVYSLREYNSITGRELSVHGDSSGIYYPLTVSPQGKNLILSSWIAGTVQIWDPQNKKIIQNYFNFMTPMNAIDFKGDLIVAELGMTAGAARILRVGKGKRPKEVQSNITDNQSAKKGTKKGIKLVNEIW